MEKEIIEFGKPGLPLSIRGISMRKNAVYRGVHSHAAIEIVRVESGTLDCYIKNEKVSVPAGGVIFINSNIQHRLLSDNADILYAHIDIGYYRDASDRGQFPALYDFIQCSSARPFMIPADAGEINAVLRKMEKEYRETREESKWYLRAYIYWLMAFMYSASFITAPAPSSAGIEKIRPIVRYINESYKSKITLDDICRVAKYNKFTVCHTFREITGSTVFDYVNYLRIRHAIEGLRQSEKNVLDIATESGFSSVTYFNKVFKKTVGCAPSVYRKHFLTGD